MPSSDPASPGDWERAAQSVLDAAAFGYLCGGAEDERTLTANTDAFARRRVAPRMLTGVADANLETRVLGRPMRTPILVAPVGHQRLFHADGELASARAAAAAGVGYCLSTMSNYPIESVTDAAGDTPRWFQLYAPHDTGRQHELVDRACALGYDAIVVTVDLPVLGRRERDLRNAFVLPATLPLPIAQPERGETALTLVDTSTRLASLSFADIERLASRSAVPVVVKGLLRADDALRAVASGARGVGVSNHGGRQLDGAVAALDALERIVDAVGDAAEVVIDSGVRRGVDVLVAIALGARAVMVGRPVMWGLAAAGEDGARRVLEQLCAETRRAMVLCGCATLDALDATLVVAGDVA